MQFVTRAALVAALSHIAFAACAQAPAAAPPQGEVIGSVWEHTAGSLAAAVQQADVVLPARATGGAVYTGKFADLPPMRGAKVPVVLFLHGSSGLGLKAIGEWQQWLATLGVASVAPNSFSLPGRVTYKSPIAVDLYERIHALRGAEIAPMLAALQAQPWADRDRLVLAGASEGGVPVARYPGHEFAARIVYSWSCEPNYFVQESKNAFEKDKPVLNVISQVDPFFSQSNAWLGSKAAKGHCGDALKDNKRASVVLVPDAPHTLLNFNAARQATAGFLAELTRP